MNTRRRCPGTTDDEKKEFLADATSFANAAGGDLIYGVRGQLFRDGGIEAFSGGILLRSPERGGFYPGWMERDAIGALNKYQKLALSIGVTPPLLVGLTLTRK